ncbi:glycosyltransferase family 9 protein [Pelagicoccus sp. SDUM812003]|uniref:glycosyltransferase family 9 protein n=1 Tax=Pelagicoccus sp. SDUM812003 TaxID=3041267 RepID=UPI00280D26B3|nr:glycosyltransferase family 9 protein [Pelagicoccus sp. SDUM812003]MDQ8205428.1 glycosyltransferase family 9 protein [Pelagicoccus sp. SDUM812003]
MKEASARLLVLMTSPLDMIAHALRAVESFKRRLPTLEVTWVVRRFYEPLVSNFRCVDRTIVFHRSAGLGKAFSLARELRRERYDFVFDFEGHARTGAMCWLARGSRKIGRSDAREGATVCYGELVSPPACGSEHALDSMLEFGRVFGLDKRLIGEPRLIEEPALSFLPNAESSGRAVCLFPGRFKRERSWPGMFELANRLAERDPSLQVFLLGMIPEASTIELADGVFDLQGKLTWAEICAALKRSALTVANDNGPAQLSDLFARPNLTLYSYVLPARRGSYADERTEREAIMAPDGDVRRIELPEVFARAEKLLRL